MDNREKRYLVVLVTGDLLTLSLVTAVGFASHGTLNTAGTRMLTTFFPLVLAWLMVAPFFGLYRIDAAREIRQIWRPVYVVLIAAPLAAWLRGILLSAPIIPVFVAVLAGSAALGVLVWRFLFLMIYSRTSD